MKTFEFIPMEAQGENPTFSGCILMKAPNFFEKYELLESLESETNADGQIVMKSNTQMSSMRKLVSAVKPFALEIKLKCLETGESYESWESLIDSEECFSILVQMGGKVIGSTRVGKSNKA